MERRVYKSILKHEEKDWWYRGLRNIVQSYIKTYKRQQGGKLLDVGCGTGYFMKQLSLRWDVYGIDISKQAINMAKARSLKNIKLASVEKIPYKNGFFNIILVLDVLEHVENEIIALKEIKRVLATDGIAIFNSPAYNFLWSYHDETAKHLRRYTKKQLQEKLEEAGFKILKITYINSLLFPIAFTHRLISKAFPPKNRKTDIDSAPRSLHSAFYKIFSFESRLIKSLNFPFGLSVSAVVTKKGV